MPIAANSISVLAGPTPLLPCHACATQIPCPTWPLLNDQPGREKLIGDLCASLRLDSRDGSWRDLLQPGDQPAALFFGRLFARTAVALQRRCKHPVAQSDGFHQPEDDGALAVWEYFIPGSGRAAGVAASLLLEAVAGLQGEGAEKPPAKAAREAVTQVKAAYENPVAEVLLEAAKKRGMRWSVVDPVWPMFQIGQGAASRRLMTSMPETLGHITTIISQNKRLSLGILREAGFPVPRNQIVRNADDAVAMAETLGYPVVVKPADGLRSQGVTVKLRSPEAVRQAFDAALKHSRAIMVEDYLPGLPYRILVLEGEVLGVVRRGVPMVRGDGRSTIDALIRQTNEERSRIALENFEFPRLIRPENFEDEIEPCLKDQGFARDSIPGEGIDVFLAYIAQTGRGGENLDVTAETHPDTLSMAIEAAAFLENTIIGLDFMTDDIARSYKEGNCGINEVNSEPAFNLHLRATRTPRDVVTPYLDQYFGAGGRGEIPIFCSLGDQDGAGFDLLCAALSGLGLQTGVAARHAAKVGRFSLPEMRRGQRPAQRLLDDVRVETALVALGRQDFQSGLAFDRCTACYLSRPASEEHSEDAFLPAHARLIIESITDSLILPLEDLAYWQERFDLGSHRLLLLARHRGPTSPTRDPSWEPNTEALYLWADDELNILHLHGDHADRLLVLPGDPEGTAAQDHGILVMLAALLVLETDRRRLREVVPAILQASRGSAAGERRQ